MTGRRHLTKTGTVLATVACLWLAASSAVAALRLDGVYSEIADACRDARGLCAVLGVADRSAAELMVALAEPGNLLVHGTTGSVAATVAAQQVIGQAGADGHATVEQLSLEPLPYRNRLVNILIVTDLTAARAAGYTETEAQRVLAPLGRLMVIDDGKLRITTKAIPAEMDEWTHNMHGADGNRASRDTAVAFPLGYLWHGGLPFNINNNERQGNRYSATRGMAVANGRCLTFSDSVIENLRPAYFLGQGLDQYLTARDAFSGVLLWRRKIGHVYYGGLWAMNTAPFAAVGDFVYTASEDGKLLVISGATGETVKALDTKFPPGQLLVDNGVLLSANWKGGSYIGKTEGGGYERIRMHSSVEEGNVEAYDATTGRLLWQRPALATSIRSADGVLFVIEREGRDQFEENRRRHITVESPVRPAQAVAALELATGKELWRVAAKDLGPDGAADDALRVDAAGAGVVSIAHSIMTVQERVSILAAYDGRLVMQPTTRELPLFIDGVIHLAGKRYDPATGAELGTSLCKVGSTICTPSYYVNGVVVNNRGGAFTVDGKNLQFKGVRGACGLGSAPAYGAFYTPQNWCNCMPTQISGFICIGTVSAVPATAELERAPAVEQGEAFNADVGAATDAAAWPMARHGAERSNAIAVDAPAALDIRWQTQIPIPDLSGNVALGWREYLNAPLTGPTVADGVAVTAAIDANQVVALDLESGEIRWRFRVGARVDSAPTLGRGICHFGAHDGYVYALESQTGKLRWRCRMAPNDERMVSYCKVESPWPVIGSVLAHEDVVYASAGRSQGADGGIVVRAFSPRSGEQLWARSNFTSRRRNDLLTLNRGTIQLMEDRMDAKTGAAVPNLTDAARAFAIATVRLERNIAKWRADIAAGGDDVKRLEKRLAADEKKLAELVKPEDEIAFSIGARTSDGMINWNWPRLGSRKFRGMAYGNLSGILVSWDARAVCTVDENGRVACYAADKVGPPTEKFAGQPDWTTNLPQGYQVTSMIQCRDAVVVAGGIYAADAPAEGFVVALSRGQGSEQAKCVLANPVVFDGAAVIESSVVVALADGAVVRLGATP